MPDQDELFCWVDSNEIEPLREALLADPSAVSTQDRHLGSTLLIFAAHRGFREIVELLLASGAEVASREQVSDSTALHWAAEGGHAEIARWLLDRGAELETRDSWFALTPLGWATVVDWAPHYREDRPDTIALLRERGAASDPFVAMAMGEIDTLRSLAEDSSVLTQRLGFVMREMTPLHFAIARGDADATALLVERGADPRATTSRGLSAFALARAGKRDDIQAILRRSGVSEDTSLDPRLLLAVAESGDAATVRKLLAAKLSPEIRVRHLIGESPTQVTALHLAAEAGHHEVVRALLEGGADPSPGREDRDPTPLHVAALFGHPECVKALLEGGADPSATERRFDSTPLGWAIHGSPGAVHRPIARIANSVHLAIPVALVVAIATVALHSLEVGAPVPEERALLLGVPS